MASRRYELTDEQWDKIKQYFEVEKKKGWTIVKKVDIKLDRRKIFSFKIIRRKKINSGMKSFCVVKFIDILEQGSKSAGLE